MSALSFEPEEPQELTPEQESEVMKVTRGFLLNECDWTQLPDTTLTPEQRQEWANYRQELRDITQNPAWPYVQWPTKPWGLS
jgi:hypothetical protein